MKELLKKLHAIASKISHLEKDGENTFHHYSYVTEAQVKEAVRKAMNEEGVVFTINESTIIAVKEISKIDAKGTVTGSQFLTTVRLKCTFYDKETGENTTVTLDSQGHDTLDKGVFKAISGGIKYILMNQFLIPTGDDPEKEKEEEKKKYPTKTYAKKPVPQESSNLKPCDKCGSNLILRNSTKGKFYGCSNYPKCKRTLTIEDAEMWKKDPVEMADKQTPTPEPPPFDDNSPL